MTIFFYKTTEFNGSNYVKTPLRFSATINIENDAKLCFLWATLGHLHLGNNYHPNRVSNDRQYLDELNIDEFDFTNVFRCSHAYIFEKINNLSIKICELSFYQEGNEWKQKIIPLENSENN